MIQETVCGCSHWKETRETEERLNDKRAKLHALERSGAGEPVNVVVHFDGPGA